MKKLILFILFLTSACTQTVYEDYSVQAENGLLDLSTKKFEENIEFSLEGYWELYWNRLLTPEDFKSNNPLPDGHIAVPGSWNSFLIDGEPAGPFGHATYRLVIKLPPDIKNEYLAIRIQQINSAYVLYINDRKTSLGKIAENPENFTPDIKPVYKSVKVDDNRIEIICQVANYFSRSGGIVHSSFIGLEHTVLDSENRKLALNLFMFGSLLIMGVYLLSLYALRRKDRSPLYFGLFSILFSIRASWDSYYHYTEFLYRLGWERYCRLEYLVDYTGPMLLGLFLYSMFKEEIPKLFVRFWIVFTVILNLLVLAAPRSVYIHTVYPFQAAVLISSLVVISALIIAVKRKRDGALLILTGFFILVTTVILEILFLNNIILLSNSLTIGIYAFIFTLSFVISLRFSRAFSTVESLSAELEQKNINLSHLNRMKDEFLANTSHELKTPLNGIIGLAESLYDRISGHEGAIYRRDLHMIASSGRRLSSLINDILDFSKLRHGDISVEKTQVDPRIIADIVIEQCTPLTGQKNIVMNNNIQTKDNTVIADEMRLQQIFFNLIGNAIKFTEHGTITIESFKKDNMLEISVKDTGVGIDPSLHESIFSSFEQGDSGIARKYGGAGLGLSITKKLVEIQDGKIRVESEPGKGSVFTFSLPLANQTDIKTIKEKPAEQLYQRPAVPLLKDENLLYYDTTDIIQKSEKNLTSPENSRLLIVDDDTVNLQVLMNILSSAGYDSISANGGREALKIIENNQVDCILLDIMMPGISGYDVLKDIRKKYKIYELPVILLTAKSQPNDIITGFNLAANDYIQKPFNKSELLSRTATHITLKKMVEDNIQLNTIKNEVELAYSILMSLIPDIPEDISSLSISAVCQPCEMLAGDFYDFHRISDHEIGILIADVTGHGISAALFSSMIKIAFHGEKENAKSPSKLLKSLNKSITGVTPNLLLTAAYAYINTLEQKIILARAGHPPAYITRINSGEFQVLKPKGSLVGWNPGLEFDTVETDFKNGDRLILYTDGITETINSEGYFYESEFIEYIKTSHENSEELINSVIKGAKSWATADTGLQDDMTIVVVDMKKKY